jgi:hypothetical protein
MRKFEALISWWRPINLPKSNEQHKANFRPNYNHELGWAKTAGGLAGSDKNGGEGQNCRTSGDLAGTKH